MTSLELSQISLEDISAEKPPALSPGTKLTLGLSENETGSGLIHTAFVRKMLEVDFLKTLISNAEDFESAVVLPEHLPPIFGDLPIPPVKILEKMLEKEEIDAKQAAEIARFSLWNARIFEERAEGIIDPDEQEKYQIMAVEAKFIQLILIDDIVIKDVLDKGQHGGWLGKAKERRAYFTGTKDDLNGYSDYEKSLVETSLKSMAEITYKAYQDLKEFGIDSFQQYFEGMGLDEESVRISAEGAVNFYEEDGNPESLEKKIEELVKDGRIPQEFRKTYQAFALAARLLDEEEEKEKEGGGKVLGPRERFEEIAEKEGIKFDPKQIAFAEKVSGDIPETAILALIDDRGENMIGSILLLPNGIIPRHNDHEDGHMIAGVVIGEKSPLLATMLPVQKAERIAAYIENKYGGAFTHYARLSSLRYALLTEAQLAHVSELDEACKSDDLEEITRILTDCLKIPTEKMERTFGKPVGGELYGYPFGALSFFGHTNNLSAGDKSKSLIEIIEESTTLKL